MTRRRAIAAVLAAACAGLLIGVSTRVAGADDVDIRPGGHVVSVPDQPWTLVNGDVEQSPVLRATGPRTSHLFAWAVIAAVVAAGIGTSRRVSRSRMSRSARAATGPAAARAPPR